MSDDIDSKCPPECGPGCWNNENNPNQCKTGPNANKENCCLLLFLRKADLTAIIKSSLPDAIYLNTL